MERVVTVAEVERLERENAELRARLNRTWAILFECAEGYTGPVATLSERLVRHRLGVTEAAIHAAMGATRAAR